MDDNSNRGKGLSRREVLQRGALAASTVAAGGALGLPAIRARAASEASDPTTLVVAVPQVPTNLDREFTFEIPAFDVLQNTMEELVEWHQVRRSDGSYTLDFNAPMDRAIAY